MSRNRWHALHEMVKRWAQTAAQVENGYGLTFDDYLNDLDLRNLIDERLRKIDVAQDGSVPVGIADALGAADEQFRRATNASDANVWGIENERDSGWSAEAEWYYYRLPKVLPEEW